MRNTLVLISIFVLALSGGEASRPNKMFKALDAGAITSLEAPEREKELDKVVATSAIPALVVSTFTPPSHRAFGFSPRATSGKPFARAPPLAA